MTLDFNLSQLESKQSIYLGILLTNNKPRRKKESAP